MFVHVILFMILGNVNASNVVESRRSQVICAVDGTCTPSDSVTKAAITMRLDGKGFHRTLMYHVELYCNGSSREKTVEDSARIVVVQPLPAALFADTYQLDGAADVSQGPHTLFFGRIDVENIEPLASNTSLAIFADGEISGNASQDNGDDVCGYYGVSVPLHSRYLRPVLPENFRKRWIWSNIFLSLVLNVTLPKPMLLVPASQKGIQFNSIDNIIMKSELPIWDVPVGNLMHAYFVPQITSILVVISLFVAMRQ